MNAQDMSFVSGVPEPLPQGERLLWQGKPNWRSIARHTLHIDKIALYFAGLAVWQMTTPLWDAEAAFSPLRVAIMLALGMACLGLLAGIAYLIGRTSLYAITSRRVIMRIGIALPVTYNVPFASIAAGSLKAWPDGTGDIPLALAGKDRIAYLHLWPHARPWRLAKPEPMLRSVPHAAHVAEILARAVVSYADLPAAGTPAPSITSSNSSGRPPRLIVAAQR